MKTIIIVIFTLCTLIANAQLTIFDYYHSIGPSEFLVADFNHSVEATTMNKYSGLVGIDISNWGYGDNNVVTTYDAFYEFGNGSVTGWTPQKSSNAHRIAFSDNTSISGDDYYIGDNTSDQLSTSIYRIVWNNNNGPYEGINFYGIPIYRDDHHYSYVLDLNMKPQELNIGFGNASGILDVFNNSGHYNVTITPLALGSVPEPSMNNMTLFWLLIFFFIRKDDILYRFRLKN